MGRWRGNPRLSLYENPNAPQPLPGEQLEQGMTQQYSQEEVGYRPAKSEAEACSSCANFQAKAQQALGQGICMVVSGQISPNGTCDLYTPRAGGLESLIGPG
jgi:hypothetical protein